MKKVILLFIIISATNVRSQVREIEPRTYFKQGDFEFNISNNLGVGFTTQSSVTTNRQFNWYDSTYSTYTYKSDFSDREFNLLMTASIGYCILDGLTIEPEFDINLVTDSDISISILGNLTYNLNIPRKRTYPFIKIGYGVSNYYSGYDYYYPGGSTDNSLDTKVFNAGIGIKLIYTSASAMKLEINYKHYSYDNSTSYGDQFNQSSIDSESSIDAISISIGYSIML